MNTRSGQTLSEVLALKDDNELQRMINEYRQRLEDAIERYIFDFAWNLGMKKVITPEQCESALHGKLAGNDPCKPLFDIICASEAKEVRMAWEVLLKLPKTNPELIEIIKEILLGEIKENADASHEIPSDATKETEKLRNVHRESDNDTEQRSADNQDQTESASRTLQQPDTEYGSNIPIKAGEDQTETQPESDKRSGREVNENGDTCNDVPPEAHTETEERQGNRSESDSDTEKTTDAKPVQAVCTSGMGQQSDTERDSAIHNEADENQPETVPGKRMQGFEEERSNNDIKDNVDSSNEIPPFHVPKENKQYQNGQSESENDTEQKSNDIQIQAESASGTVQQSDTKSEMDIAFEEGEVQPETPSEAENRSDRENANTSQEVTPDAHKETEERQSDHSESDSEAEQQLHADQEQAVSASATGQPSDTECEGVDHNEADKDQPDTVPAGNGINGFEENRSDNEIKENADASHEIPSDATKETEKLRNVHRESDNDTEQRSADNQDQTESASRTLQQPDTEYGSNIPIKAGEDQTETQPESDKRSGREVNENGDTCNDVPPEAHTETEERQGNRSESDSDTEKTTDAKPVQAVCTSGMGQQSDTERDSAIHNEADENQPETVPGKRMQGFEEERSNNDIKDNVDSSNENPPFHVPKENKQYQNGQSESENDTEQKSNDIQIQAESASGTVQQSDTKSEMDIAFEEGEVQPETPSEAENRSDRENANTSQEVTPDAHKETEERQSDHSESDSEAEQQLHADQEQAVSASATGQPSDTECEGVDHNEADKDQPDTVPAGNGINGFEENRSDNEIKENADASHEIPSDATKETEKLRNVHRESDNDTEQRSADNQDQTESASRTLQQPDTEYGSNIPIKAGEDQTETQPESDKRSGREVNENGDTCNDVPPEAHTETEERQGNRSESDSDTEKTTDAKPVQAVCTSGMGQQSDIERDSAIHNEADENQPETVPGKRMQGFEEERSNNDIKDNVDSSNEIPPFHVPKENKQYQNGQSESENDTEQKSNDIQIQAESASGTVQQSDTKSEMDIAFEEGEVQPETPSEAENRSDRENANTSQEVTPDAHKETEERQSDHSESDSEAEQQLHADQEQAVSASATGQPSDTECEGVDHNEADKDQPDTVPAGNGINGFEENRSDNEIKENADAAPEIPSHATKETEQRQNVLRESDSHSEQISDGNQDQADSASRTLQQSDTERGSAIVSKVGEDQTETQPESDKRSDRDPIHEAERLHRKILRNQSEQLKGTYTKGNEMAESRLFDDAYIDLKICATQRQCLFLENEGIQGDNSEQDSEVEFHQLFGTNDTLSDKTTVTVVCGAAGSGKSTMIQKIIRDWAAKNKYKQFKFVFHLKCRQLNAKDIRRNLNSLLADTYPYLENYLQHVWKEPRSILFMLDDFDEFAATINFRDDERNSDPHHQCFEPLSYCFVPDIVRCLIQGDLLKGCTVLITTRPWKLETLRQTTVDVTSQLTGFTFENVMKYFRHYFRDQDFASDAIQRIEWSDILRSMCSNPLFCSILASSLEPCQTLGEGHRSNFAINHTRVLSAYVTTLLRICAYDAKNSRNCLLKLGEFAYNGIVRKIFSFEPDSSSELNDLLPNFISAFMIQVPDQDSRGVVNKFTHSALQEFVAALMKSLTTPGIRLKQMLVEACSVADGRFDTFSSFTVGLSSRKSTDGLEWELGSFPSDSMLYISDWLKENIERFVSNLESKYIQGRFINVMHCLLEFEETDLMREILVLRKTIKLNQLMLKVSDCAVLCTILATYPEVIEELDLSSCRVQLDGIELLKPVLHRCKTLRLNEINLRDSGVKRIASVLESDNCNIQRLELKSNQLTDDCLEGLFSALRTNRSLTELDLSNCNQDGEHANRFSADKLQNIRQSSARKKEIRLIRHQDIEQNISKTGTASNVLTVITE